ncbi:MAG TPA: hypothetical protein PLT82_08130, partial [Candidatus Hydrogenedens sp.]|nr:hypothetical protein [Candidatus Hydrogenedens sp.]
MGKGNKKMWLGIVVFIILVFMFVVYFFYPSGVWHTKGKGISLSIREVPRGVIRADKVPKTFVVSPDSKRYAYLAKRGDKWLVVVDGEESKEYDMSPVGLIFSADSHRVAYGSIRGGMQFVVVDGVEGKEYDGIGEPGVIFS